MPVYKCVCVRGVVVNPGMQEQQKKNVSDVDVSNRRNAVLRQTKRKFEKPKPKPKPIYQDGIEKKKK